jgi:hypothetical protein
MIPLFPLLLARSDEDSMIKLIFGAIVAIFWVGGAIISAINKRVQENKRRAQYGQMPPTFMRPIPPPVPNPAGFSNAPAKAKAAKKAAKRKPVPAVPQPQARPALSVAAAASAPAAPSARPAATAQAAPSAIARLLRRPETLRAALILNEVLSPPLSLRHGVQSGRRVE